MQRIKNPIQWSRFQDNRLNPRPAPLQKQSKRLKTRKTRFFDVNSTKNGHISAISLSIHLLQKNQTVYFARSFQWAQNWAYRQLTKLLKIDFWVKKKNFSKIFFEIDFLTVFPYPKRVKFSAKCVFFFDLSGGIVNFSSKL